MKLLNLLNASSIMGGNERQATYKGQNIQFKWTAWYGHEVIVVGKGVSETLTNELTAEMDNQ